MIRAMFELAPGIIHAEERRSQNYSRYNGRSSLSLVENMRSLRAFLRVDLIEFCLCRGHRCAVVRKFMLSVRGGCVIIVRQQSCLRPVAT